MAEASEGSPKIVYGRIYGATSLGAILEELAAAGNLLPRESDPDSYHLDPAFVQRAVGGSLSEVDSLVSLLGRWGYSLAIVPNTGGLAIDMNLPWAEYEAE